MLALFDGTSGPDDTDFAEWIDDHADHGFVINTNRAPSRYAFLHRASCRTLRPSAANQNPRQFTGGSYIKVCSKSIDELRQWLRANNPTLDYFSGLCGHCNPAHTRTETTLLETKDVSIFDPKSLEDGRRQIERSIAVRQGARSFRMQILRAYENRCAITGCAEKCVLEAAHIHPYWGPQTNDVRNGILLRADIHTLLDLLMISFDDNYRVVVSRNISSCYSFLDYAQINLPTNPLEWPEPKMIAHHKQRFDKQNAFVA